MPTARAWIKMLTAGAVMCVGGPALVYYVSPSEEELFKRYNPELQKRSLEGRRERQEEFDHFVSKLKEYSKSDRHIWEVAAADERKRSAGAAAKSREEQQRAVAEAERLRQEVRAQADSS